MDRRTLMIGALGGAAAATAGLAARPARGDAGDGAGAPLPKRDRVRVAFMLGEGANVIDTAGPWEVFQDVMLHGGPVHDPFQLYTVAATKEPVQMTGGMKVQPRHSIADAPQPHVIVIPAQRSSPQMLAWLKAASAKADVTMSVCTGAFQLARAGLLEGMQVTTHHDYWDDFAREFPALDLKRGPRFVDNGRIASAGGLTSGIDLALHVVRRYYGEEVATATARYMEHASDAWRTGVAAT